MSLSSLFLRWSAYTYLLILILNGTSKGVYAAPANPTGHNYEQPDGSKTPILYLNGDEKYNWMADSKGYTVVQDSHGWYVYAKKESGLLQPTAARVGTVNPKKLGLNKHLQTDHDLRKILWNDLDTQDHRALIDVPETSLCNFEGTKDEPCRLRGLVVLVRFTDHHAPKRILPDPEDYDTLFNHNGPTNDDIAPSGSVADVFLENSYDTFVLQSIVTPWVEVDRSEEETVDNNNGLSNSDGPKTTWARALSMLEQQGFNLEQFDKDKDGVFDSLLILHSGAAAETAGVDCETGKDYKGRVWSHATRANFFSTKSGIKTGRFYVASGVWATCSKARVSEPRSKWEIARIAVIAHECAHFLGLPDLYDAHLGVGVGNFDMQANMWGWYGTQHYPPLLSAWSKLKLNWVRAVNVTQTEVFQLRKSCTSDTVLRIDHGMPDGEYFLIENRYACGFDLQLRDRYGDKHRNGIAIWHIDETGIGGSKNVHFNTEGTPEDDDWPARHYQVALVQGDGLWQLEKGHNRGDETDLFRLDPNRPNSAYYIGPSGVKRSQASDLDYPNTNSYAHGYEVETGIHIQVGEPGPTMKVSITIETSQEPGGQSGSTRQHESTSPTADPTVSRRTNSPTYSPTHHRPTNAPTVRPTDRPSQRPTMIPTLRPTRGPSPLPSPQPTQSPMPKVTNRPTSQPTRRPSSAQPTLGPTPSPTPGSTSKPTEGDTEPHVTGFTLIDADTDDDMYLLKDEMTLVLSELPDTINVRADTVGTVGSVVFDIDGQWVRTESFPPYALGGDWMGNYVTWTPTKMGSQTLTATIYSESGGNGVKGNSRSVFFTLWRDTSSQEQTSSTPQPTANPTSRPTRDPSNLFIFRRPTNRLTDQPTSLPTDRPSSAEPTPSPTPSPTPNPTSSPTAGNRPYITGFTLVNADTDEDMYELADEMRLVLSELPDSINVRADTAGTTVGSVVFDIDGQWVRTESYSPYALGGDWSGNYIKWTPTKMGSQTLTATIYSESGGNGVEVNSRSVTFAIFKDGTPEPTSLRSSRTPTNRPTKQEKQSADSLNRSGFAVTCDNYSWSKVMLKGERDDQRVSSLRIKTCKTIGKSQTEFCDLDDISAHRPEGWKVWQTCQKECESITGC